MVNPFMDDSYLQKNPIHSSLEEAYYPQQSRGTPQGFQMKQFSSNAAEYDTSYSFSIQQGSIPPGNTNFAPSISIPPHNPAMVMGTGNYAQQGYLFDIHPKQHLNLNLNNIKISAITTCTSPIKCIAGTHVTQTHK